MKLNTVFVAWAVVNTIFGLGFLLVPATLMSGYGVAALPPDEIALGRLLGASYLGYAVLAWVARSINEPSARRKIVLANLVGTTLSLAVFLKTTLIDGRNTAPEWFNVVLMGVFVVGFGYFYFTKQE